MNTSYYLPGVSAIVEDSPGMQGRYIDEDWTLNVVLSGHLLCDTFAGRPTCPRVLDIDRLRRGQRGSILLHRMFGGVYLGG